jgi:hypothetical protein
MRYAVFAFFGRPGKLSALFRWYLFCFTPVQTRRGGVPTMRIDLSPGKLSDWQLVFSQSKVNGAAYNGDALEKHNWDWPKGTYFQRRLSRIKYLKSADDFGSKRAS